MTEGYIQKISHFKNRFLCHLVNFFTPLSLVIF